MGKRGPARSNPGRCSRRTLRRRHGSTRVVQCHRTRPIDAESHAEANRGFLAWPTQIGPLPCMNLRSTRTRRAVDSLDLDSSPAVCLIQGPLHRRRHAVRVEHGTALLMSGSPPDHLQQRGVGAEEALGVGIQDANERHLWEVQPLVPCRACHRASRQLDAEIALKCVRAALQAAIESTNTVSKVMA